MCESEVSQRTEILKELQSPTEAGRNRRRELQSAVKQTCHEFHGLGVEMNQHYNGPGIYHQDEPRPYQKTGRELDDEILHHEPSTYPGSRLPHVWLNTAVPGKAMSTIDLVGHGAFTLLTGIGGDSWKQSAGKVAKLLQIPLKAHSIGFRQDWEDAYFDWETVRGVEESGAVLVRPDRFVAWRAPHVLDSVEQCEAKLLDVMKSVLGRQKV